MHVCMHTPEVQLCQCCSPSHQIDADTYWNDVTSQAAKMVLLLTQSET